MIGNCGTCTYWAKNVADWEERERWIPEWQHYPCLRIKHDAMYHSTPDSLVCPELHEEEDLAVDRKDMKETDDAVVEDGSGYFAALKVRESFGCVFHEEKQL